MSHADPLDEHAFTPKDKSLTAVFPDSQSAHRARAQVLQSGVASGLVDLVELAPPEAVPNPEAARPDSGAEIGHAFQETFSDDDKVYVQFDRVLAAGGSILSIDLSEDEDARTALAKQLRGLGAEAVYYWGTWATERL